jgi:acylphosphatase
VSVVHIEVMGRVQGIGFRWFVRERALALQLSGWVRNLETGTVEIAASGPDDVVREFLAAVREGPPGAHVRQVVPLAPVPDHDFPDPFAIVR